MRSFKFFFIMVMALTGCATIRSINKNAFSVNFSDGVSKKEAVFLVQKDCLDNNYCRSNYVISAPKVLEDKSNSELWIVKLPPEHIIYRFTHKCWVNFYVNKSDGKILARTIDK
ncbi:MAG: hypothetical protein JW867_08355 [Candidatus Omnitrophica bacterium]|nr:hypothetical protein [Candidatus Omnitrophota bacterium]